MNFLMDGFCFNGSNCHPSYSEYPIILTNRYSIKCVKNPILDMKYGLKMYLLQRVLGWVRHTQNSKMVLESILNTHQVS